MSNNYFAVEIILRSLNEILDYLEEYINRDIDIYEFAEHYNNLSYVINTYKRKIESSNYNENICNT